MNQSEEAQLEKRRKEALLVVQTTVTTLSAIFQRQKNIDDLMLRSCLFVDKLSLSLEIIGAVLQALTESEIDEGNLPQSIKPQIASLRKIIGEELDALMMYCRAPSFSADAPFGSHVVKETGKRFENSAFANDNNP